MAAVGMRVGRRFNVQWEAGEDWQSRIIVGPATRQELVEIMAIDATEEQEKDGKIWFCLTPDLDVYPMLVDSPELRGVELLENDGQVLWRTGRRRGGRQVRG